MDVCAPPGPQIAERSRAGQLARRLGPFALAIAVLTVLWLPTLWFPFGRDQGLWAAIVDAMHRGGMPYHDGITLKPPGILYLFSGVLALWRDMRAIHVMELFLLGVEVVFMALLFPPRRRWVLAPLFAFMLGVFHFHFYTHWYMATPDNFIAVPVVIGLWVRDRWGTKHPVTSRLAIGFLVGLSFWLKYTGGIFLLLFWGLDLVDRRGSALRAPLKFLRNSAFIGVGFAFSIALVLLHFAAKGALPAFVEVQVDYMSNYAGFQANARRGDLRFLGWNISNDLRGITGLYYVASFIVWPLIPMAIVALLRRRLMWGRLWFAAFLAVLSVAAQKRYMPYHWGPAVPWLVMLSALGYETSMRWLFLRQPALRRLRGSLAEAWPPRIAAIVVAIAASLFLLRDAADWAWKREVLGDWWSLATQQTEDDRNFLSRFGEYGEGDFSFVADREVADHIRATTPPDSEIFIWGFEPLVYFLADRPAASRFLSSTTLVNPGAPAHWRQEVLKDLQQRPPELFLVLEEDQFGFLHGVHGDSKTTLNTVMPDLETWMHANYTLETKIEHFTIYRHVSGGTP